MRRLLIALLVLAAALVGGGGFAAGTANAAAAPVAAGLPTTLSDQWWKADESGWGAAVLQQADVLFVCFFVYGSDGKPTWFVAVANAQPTPPAGHVVYSGKLYVTQGPYFAGPFDPAAAIEREAGTFTFDATAVDAAVMRYTVDGVVVEKPVTRQTWVYANLGGDYYGGVTWDQACGPLGDQRSHHELLGSLQVAHTTAQEVTITLKVTRHLVDGAEAAVPANATASISGSYTQAGHLGEVRGSFGYALGAATAAAPAVAFEIDRTANGVTGRFNGASDAADRCSYQGQFGAVLR
jgi:hypothetical protein